MSKQINVRLPDDAAAELERLLSQKGTSISKFVADAISLAMAVEKNMDSQSHSRLIIENPKGTPSDYKLLLKSA